MTENGFEPDPVTVDVNQTVIFVNKDLRSRWPASNVHPTHELYPEFDPRRTISPGDSWAFKPQKKGEWKYHDHLLPHIRGTLKVIGEGKDAKVMGEKSNQPKVNIGIVERIKNLINGIFSKISNIFTKPSSLVSKSPTPEVLGIESFVKLSADDQLKALKDITQNQGAKEAWEYIKNSFKGQGGSSGNIHDLAHLAGSLIYQNKGFEGIGICTSEFAFGCFHGFLDGAFKTNLDRLEDAKNACSKLGPPNSGPVASCIHGIGHGIASFYSVKDLKKSLAACRKLESGNEYCFDGVFMEFVRNGSDDLFKKEDPLYPCDDLEKDFGYVYSFACGRNQPTLLMSRFNLGFDEVVKICLDNQSKPFKEACFNSLGFTLARSGDPKQIIEGCQKIPDSFYQTKCATAAAGELVFQEIPGWQQNYEVVCKALQEGQDECLNYVQRIIKEYDKEVKKFFRYINLNEDLNSYLREELGICYGSGGRDGCYKDVAKIFFDQFGLRKTLDLLKENENYPEVYARCHEVTHYLSRSEYEKQKDIGKVYAQCDSTCHGGCYHGTLEQYLKERNLKSDEDLYNEFSKICGKEENYQKPLEFNECLHGLGHAAMFVLDMELNKSLWLCDSLPEQAHKERCYTGVFMENSSSSTSFDHKSKFIKPDDPFYPCNSLEEKYLPLCWQYQSSYFAIIKNEDWGKVAQMCLQIPEKYQERCFRTIGTNQVGFTSSFDTMHEDCKLMPTANFVSICINGVVSSLSYRFVGETKKMIDFCSLVENEYKEGCFKQMGTGLLDWSKDKDVARNHCLEITGIDAQTWCLSAIGS